MIYFETKRLKIRDVEPGDAQDILTIMNDERVLRYNCVVPPTPEQVRENIEKGRYDYCIELCDENRVIGTIGLSFDIRHEANSLCISYELNTDYTKKGYMTEALQGFLTYCFEVLKKDVISARVFTENQDSISLLRRLGFTHEGTLRHAVKAYSGIVYDDMLFSMLREEFLEKKKA